MGRMARNREENFLKGLLKVTGIVAFIADCIAIYAFIRSLLGGETFLQPSERMMSLAAVIILAFVLSLALIRFSGRGTSGLFAFFGLVYAFYGAAFLAVASFTSINNRFDDPIQLVDYGIFVIALAVFCLVVMARSQVSMKWAAIPFILASILHIGFALLVLLSYGRVPLLSHVFLLLGIIIVTVFFGKDKL
jgi:hypothetical protein